MAYALARVRQSLRTPLVMLIMLPFWTPLLIRVYAWTGILNSNGLINNALMNWAIDQPLPLLHNEFAVHLGIVYSYLPFMVLPIYAVLSGSTGACWKPRVISAPSRCAPSCA